MNAKDLEKILKRNSQVTVDPAYLLDFQYNDPEETGAMPKQSLWASEDDFMRAVLSDLSVMSISHPDLRWVYHVANENSHRRPGVKAGVPDLVLPIPRGKFHSLYVELKILGGRLSSTQRAYIDFLKDNGNMVCVAEERVSDAINAFYLYLTLEKPI